MISLPDAALALAITGLPVFPCRPGHKEPLTAHGFEDATADLYLVTEWWRRWPAANVAIATGQLSVDILDVDNHGELGNGFRALRKVRDAGLATGAHRLVRTPHGGLHLYYRPSGCRNGSLRRHHLDCRGDGGYVLVPPSIVDGKPYEILEDRPDAQGRLDWRSIRSLLDPPRGNFTGFIRPNMTGNATALAAWLSTVTEGGRNCALFWACCRLVEGGATDLGQLEPLLAVAQNIGLPSHEAESTARSALRTVVGAVA